MIGGKSVSQTHILMASWIRARYAKEDEKKYVNDEARYEMIYKGAIGTSLKEHFIAALRLPLHPSAGQPNDPYNPNSKSPLSNAALAFVHGGFKYTSTQKKWVDNLNFPEKINHVAASLLEEVQGLKIQSPFKPRGMRLYSTQLYFSDLVIARVRLTLDERDLLNSESGPLWYRGWADGPEVEAELCHEVRTVLKKTGTMIVIVGHTTVPVRILSF